MVERFRRYHADTIGQTDRVIQIDTHRDTNIFIRWGQGRGLINIFWHKFVKRTMFHGNNKVKWPRWISMLPFLKARIWTHDLSRHSSRGTDLSCTHERYHHQTLTNVRCGFHKVLHLAPTHTVHSIDLEVVLRFGGEVGQDHIRRLFFRNWKQNQFAE